MRERAWLPQPDSFRDSHRIRQPSQGGPIVPILEGRYGIHKLRHVAASLFIAHLGWTPKRLQEIMGHASITQTFDLYGHMFEDHEGDQDAMKRLEASIGAA